MWRRFKWPVVLGVLILSSLAFRRPVEKYFDIAKSLDIFATLFKEVNAYYVDEVDPEKLVRVGIDGMLESLDPYTDYIAEEDMDNFRISTTGQYAGIGALIGIGLIGSLVTTKTSLSSIFGVASSQMDSAGGASAQTLPTSAIASTWSSKIVSSITKTPIGSTGLNQVSYAFADGSSVLYRPTTGPGGAQNEVVTFIDAAVNPYKTIQILPIGQNGVGTNPYYQDKIFGAPGTANAGKVIQTDQFSSNYSNTGTATNTIYYYNNGQSTSYATQTVNLANYAVYFNDVKYFDSIQ